MESIINLKKIYYIKMDLEQKKLLEKFQKSLVSFFDELVEMFPNEKRFYTYSHFSKRSNPIYTNYELL